MAIIPVYRDTKLKTKQGEISIHHVEAGDKHTPTILLLHGFPTSATAQFRDLIYLLADSYHVIAPDFPGFGFTKAPSSFVYSFENIADVITSWVEKLALENYSMYVFDYGAAVGWRLALAHPEQISAVITQNGNAYEVGFGQQFWKSVFDLWKSKNGKAERDFLRDNVLTLSTTKFQYTSGVPDKDLELLDPKTWTLDFLHNLAGAENQERQLDLFYDYRLNLDLYPKVQEWFRSSQVPLMAIWGRGDPIFIPAGAEAFKADLPKAVVRFVDSGHFALETQRIEIAQAMKQFLSEHGI